MAHLNFNRKLTAFLMALFVMFSSVQVNAQRKKSISTPAGFELKSSMLSTLKFRSVGPAAYSGRISDIAVNPENTSEYYVGVASGGLWKTVNHGTTFEPIFDSEKVFSIGCLALDPNNPNVLWVGTGENNSQRNLAYGDGVYKTTDGGKTFTNMGLETSRQIGKIMVDPRNSDVVYVASQGQAWGPGGERGLYKTIDGGKNWERVLHVDEFTGASDMEMDPRNPDILYVSMHQRERRVYSKINGGPGSAIYKSVDAGKTWTKLKTGLPRQDLGRIGLALSPANPDVIYAVIELSDSKSGFYRSTDKGESWEKMSDQGTSSPQYYNEIYADPVDQDVVYIMDTRQTRTEDGGKTWSRVGEKNKHVDNHAIWIDPTDTRHLISGCDGGLYESYDYGENWIFKSNLPITQYYHARVDNAYPFYNIYGGAQDNGSWYGPSRTRRYNIVNADWTYTIGGDGYLSTPDPNNPNLHYCESQYCGLRRYDHITGNSVFIQPQPTENEEFRWNWNTPYVISNFDSKTLYVAGNYVFKSTDQGDSWKKISADLTRQIDPNSLPMMGKIWPPEAIAKGLSTSAFGNIFALAESPLKQGMLYVGTDDGLIWRTEDDGANWVKYDKFPGVPEMTFVNYILPSQHNENVVYTCFDGRKNSSDFKPYLLKSTDKGQTWTSIASNLPSGTIYVIQEDHVNPNILFIGTEWGVWVTIDGGQKWEQLNKGIPTIQVKDMDIQERENDLVVATFGRGFYVLDDYSELRELSAEIEKKDAHMFAIKDALLYFPSSNLNYQGEVHFRAENPDPEAKFEFFIRDGFQTMKQKRMKETKAAEKAGRPIPYPTEEELEMEENEEVPELVFTIYDANGDIMRKLSTKLRDGYQSMTWDFGYMSRRGPKVPPGEYTVAVDKSFKGEFTRLIEPQKFKVIALENALGTPNYAENFAFMKQVIDFNNHVTAANAKLDNMQDRVDAINNILSKTPVEANALVAKLLKVQEELDGIDAILNGSVTVKNSITGRVGYASYITSRVEVNVTGSQREQYKLAKADFESLQPKIESMYNQVIPGLEKELEELGGVLMSNTPERRGWWEE